MTEPTADHAFIYENMGAYLAGALDPAERARFDAHINNCPECFDAFSEARDADRAMQRTLADLNPDAKFEEQLITHIRETTMNRWQHPVLRRAAYATAAAIALAATGVFANFALHQDGRFNNPLSRQLVAKADAQAPTLASPVNWLSERFGKQSAAAAKGKDLLYDNVPIDTILSDFSKRYGFVVIQTMTPGNRVTLHAPAPATPDQAVKMLDNLLVPLGYAMIQTLSGEGSDTKTVLRLASVAETKKSQLPVHEGSDPSQIPLTDDIITQVIPLKNVDAISLRKDIAPLVSTDADIVANIASNSIVVTDTSAKIHSLAEAVKKLDIQKPIKPAIEYRQLINTNAAEAAKMINEKFPGAKADSDARTNTVVLNGPPDKVAQAKDMLNRVDTIPVDKLYTSVMRADGTIVDKTALSLSERLALENIQPRSGQEVMSQHTDSADHLIPYSDLMVYPNKWPDLANKSALATNTGPAPSSDPKSFVFYNSLDTKDSAAKSSSSLPPVQYDADIAGRMSPQSIGNTALAYNSHNATTDSYFKQLPTPADTPTQFSIGAGSSSNLGISGANSFNGPPAAALAGAGTVTLSGNANTYTGNTSINGGTLTTAGAGAVYSAGSRSLTEGIATNVGGNVTPPNASKGISTVVPNNTEAGRELVRGIPFSPDGQFAPDGQKDKLPDTLTPTNGTLNMSIGENRFVAGYSDLGRNTLAAATPNQPAAPATQASSPPATAPSTQLPDPTAALKIIRNGTIEFEVRSFDDTYLTITQISSEERGFVSSTSSEKLANGHVRGTIVVRIPPERLDRFLLKIRSLGDLKAQQIGAADVTKQYYDIESELRGLTTMETRLLDLIKNGKGEVKDLIEAEKQLGDTRVRIEKLEGEISYYNNLVSLATITITAYEKDIQSPTAASEQENIVANVETEEVEAKYQAARKVFEDAKGRIVESQLKNTDAEHIAAHIVADVPPDQADFVANQLKQLGKVASFNRDRKQTTTGGTGTPQPGVSVEKKDTRFTLELFNLANLAPRETTVIRVAVRDVEASYKAILSLVKQPPSGADALVGRPLVGGADALVGRPLVGGADALVGRPPVTGANAATTQPTGASAPLLPGRVLSSNLTGQQPDQMSADIRAEVRADNADPILAAIRSSGEVLTGSLNTNPDNANTTSAKRGIQLTLVNIASVSPKEADTINLAVRDVDGAYKSALALIRKAASPPQSPAAVSPEISLLPPTVGRVLSATMNGNQPAQLSADIRAEIRADQDADLLTALRAAGEILGSTATENPDTVNVTRAKRGLMLHFVNVAAVSPREVQELHGVAAGVADSYRSLLTALQDLAAKGDARIVGSSLSDTDPRSVNARLTFEAQRSALDAVEKAFTAAGIEFPSRNIVRSADTANTLDSKVGFSITDLRAAETLDPKRTITLGVEVDDVERAVARLKSAVTGLGQKARESDFNVNHDPSGRVGAHIVLDTYVSATPAVLDDIVALNGLQKSYQETRNSQAPETKSFTKERIDLTLTSHAGIVQSDQGIAASARAALSSAAGALLYSMYLVLTGLLFILPFGLILWPVWSITKRRKAKA